MTISGRIGGLATLAAMVAMSACTPNIPASVAALDKPPGIANLLRERLRSELMHEGAATPPPLTFPARVRIVPYDYQTGLQSVDTLTQLDGLADALKKVPGVAKDASVLPEAYGDSIGASFDGLMKLRTTARADAFVLVSGRSTFLEATSKGVNFFEWLGRKSNWEAQVTLEALWIEAPSGRFLPSLQAAGKAGPEVVVPDDRSTGGAAYGLRRTAEVQAFKRLTDALVGQLKAEVAAQPSPSPTPSAAITTAPAAASSAASSASPSVSPSVAPSAAASTPAASPSAEASPAS